MTSLAHGSFCYKLLWPTGKRRKLFRKWLSGSMHCSLLQHTYIANAQKEWLALLIRRYKKHPHVRWQLFAGMSHSHKCCHAPYITAITYRRMDSGCASTILHHSSTFGGLLPNAFWTWSALCLLLSQSCLIDIPTVPQTPEQPSVILGSSLKWRRKA